MTRTIDTRKLGQAIKKRRMQNPDFTIRYFAEKVGVSHVHLCRIENHGAMVSINTLNSICRILGVDADMLIGEALS